MSDRTKETSAPHDEARQRPRRPPGDEPSEHALQYTHPHDVAYGHPQPAPDPHEHQAQAPHDEAQPAAAPLPGDKTKEQA